jgi:hypothetical protein
MYLTCNQGVDFHYIIEKFIDTKILTNKSCNRAHQMLPIHECKQSISFGPQHCIIHPPEHRISCRNQKTPPINQQGIQEITGWFRGTISISCLFCGHYINPVLVKDNWLLRSRTMYVSFGSFRVPSLVYHFC